MRLNRTWGHKKGNLYPSPTFSYCKLQRLQNSLPKYNTRWQHVASCTIYLFWDSLWSVILPGIYPTSGRGSLLSTFLPLPLPVPSEMPFCLHISCANPSAPACWCPIFVACSPHWLFWSCVGIGNGLSLPPWWVCGQAHLAHFCILSTCHRAWPPQTLAE